MLLTLFLVQHHRPEERGVLPRAIRPRLQQAAPLAPLTASPPGKMALKTRGWQDYASINQKKKKRKKKKKPLERWIAVCTFLSPSSLPFLLSPYPPLSIKIHTQGIRCNTRRDPPYPDRSATQINRDQTALVALDKFHANGRRRRRGEREGKKKTGKTMKSDINLVSPCLWSVHTRTDQTRRLNGWALPSLLIFSLSRSHLLRNGNYTQTNPIAKCDNC